MLSAGEVARGVDLVLLLELPTMARAMPPRAPPFMDVSSGFSDMNWPRPPLSMYQHGALLG